MKQAKQPIQNSKFNIQHSILITMLLAGCADSPLKQADIEERDLTTVATPAASSADLIAKSDAAAAAASKRAQTTTDKPAADVNVDAKTGVNTAGMSEAEITAKTQKTAGVETHGISHPDPEGKSLSTASIPMGGGSGGGKKYGEGSLNHDAPVLDPADPTGPLAQRRIQFDFDSATIRDEYRTLLEMHAKYLKNAASAKLILQGHADERGSREYNLALGQRRSESVYRAMNLLGVSDAQMEAVSLGEEKPVAEAHEESSWAQNRRVELLYQGE